ncbi:type II toxin-antitoxin system RelE/ParE family toxin [Mesorhizobium sp. J428]|jgi:mRNA interferase RelE/StbE|uniref:type II toxin-antitoxin system RelE family toxin n=1 Tax=Mesorhizobium sp. J428 TaxID=2898440 RepID=UPI0021519A32|nr:type II toxin-antitoxin system RelE/ParE family toxin [Mesorhizobium sp. J428]MCR5855373.1 type II toxin-antitoxin system RelE/ParE family toxin [Mesorhizobium sp. J428]
MPWQVRFERRAEKDLERLGSVDRVRIARFIHDRIAAREDPREVGEALHGPLGHYWKYRVGDFRVIASIDDATVTVLVVRIGNRREIYR